MFTYLPTSVLDLGPGSQVGAGRGAGKCVCVCGGGGGVITEVIVDGFKSF